MGIFDLLWHQAAKDDSRRHIAQNPEPCIAALVAQAEPLGAAEAKDENGHHIEPATFDMQKAAKNHEASPEKRTDDTLALPAINFPEQFIQQEIALKIANKEANDEAGHDEQG